MKRFFLAAPVFFVLSLFPVGVVSALTAPWSDASYQYTVTVRDNGSAAILVRVSIPAPDGKASTYALTLPLGSSGSVRAWYREDGGGCIYPLGSDAALYPYPCRESGTSWVESKVEQTGDTVRILLPKTKQPLTLGVRWEMKDITKKSWWGRTITVETAGVDHFVSYVQVAVSVPDGVYVRDTSVGPVGWGDMTTGVMRGQAGSLSGADEKVAFAPSMFDMMGGGIIVKTAQNLSPGERYTFSIPSATSRWKLFIPELTTMAAGVVGLILVSSLLLRLLVGRRPLWWYGAVVTLVAVFAVLVVWLLRMYRFVPIGPDYPVMMYKAESVPPER